MKFSWLILIALSSILKAYDPELLACKIVVTGHRGLLGKSLVSQLELQGFKNIIGISSREIDLRDQGAVLKLFQELKPDYVFHCAGRVGGIGDNMAHPADFLVDNLLIGTSVLVAAKETQVKRLLYFSTACAYPRDCPQPMLEEYLLAGKPEPTNDGYAVSKIACGLLAQKINEQYETSYLTVLPTNLYGIHDHFNEAQCHVIPALINRFVAAKRAGLEKVTIWGSGKPVRDFAYAEDVAQTAIKLMFEHTLTGYINIGSGKGISIRELAEKIKNIVGFEGELQFDESKPDGMPVKVASADKLHALKLHCSTSMEEGLRTVIEYYIAHKAAQF